ncbi:MAG: GMC oxidoreductase, partial [Anaerolineae bacterium]|nr:GMC oxidoreductase [Anaerolineae bacterium]
DPKWAGLQDWKQVLRPCFDTAKRMLGVTRNPYLGQGDKLLQAAAQAQGYGDSFYATEVGIYFGKPGVTVPDPYFGGSGPERTGCILCGGCMVGCRHGAKNTLDKNYLYLAEQAGASIVPETMVVDVHPLANQADGREGYRVSTINPTRWFGRTKRRYTTRGLVFSAGVLGTVKLLLKLKASGALPNLSDQVGQYVRTNSEAIIGVRLDDKTANLSDGIAIGSGIYLDKNTHVEAVRYPNGSDAMGLLSTVLTGGQAGPGRILTWLGAITRAPRRLLTALRPVGFARSTLILLVMQTLDSQLTMRFRRSLWPPFRKKLITSGPRIPTLIPQANRFAEQLSRQFKGTPLTALTEILFDVPTTAHILGGAAMGATAKEGVIDSTGRVFNYKNMYVCDGSMISANLGVNPSLTITALAEYAMSQVKPISETTWSESGSELT